MSTPDVHSLFSLQRIRINEIGKKMIQVIIIFNYGAQATIYVPWRKKTPFVASST